MISILYITFSASYDSGKLGQGLSVLYSDLKPLDITMSAPKRHIHNSPLKSIILFYQETERI
jgi:hypothetical protein